MVKKVFYIEKAEFLRSMLEFALKAKGAEIYTIASLKDHQYLLEDLKPDLIIFDIDTCIDELQDVYKYQKQHKVVLVASGPENRCSEYSQTTGGYLTKPIVAKDLANRILSFIS